MKLRLGSPSDYSLLGWLVLSSVVASAVSQSAFGASVRSGEPYIGSIASGQWVTNTFNATNNDTVYVSLVKVGGDLNYQPSLQIYQPGTGNAVFNGDMVAATTPEIGTWSAFHAEASGTYSMVVGDANEANTGSYRVLVLRVPAALPVQQFEPDAVGPLLSGLPLTASNAPSGDLDLISFDAINNETVYVSLAKVGGDLNYQPSLQIYQPGTGNAVFNGDMVAATTPEVGTWSAFHAEASGTYSMVVGDANEANTGSYRVLMLRVPAALPVQQFEPDAVGPLLSGLPLTASNAPSGDLDLISFNAINNDTVYVSLVKVGGDLNYQPSLQIYQPGTGNAVFNGDMVAATTPEVGTWSAFHAEASGTYSMVVGDANEANTGSYRVLVLRVPAALPVQQFEPDAVGPLLSGLPLTASNAPSGDLDLISFDAINNETVYVSLAKVGGDLNYQPSLQIYQPGTGNAVFNGDMVAATTPEVGTWSTFRVGASGTYSMVVGDANEANTGSYRVLMLRVPAALPVQQFEPDAVGPLPAGVPVTATIGPSGDLDMAPLSARAGDVLTVSLYKVSGQDNFNPGLQIYEPGTGNAVWNGGLVAGTISGGGDTAEFTAAASGAYSVVVGDYASGYTGSYQVVVSGATHSPPAIVSQPASVTALANSSVIFSLVAVGTGPLSYRWRFNGQNIAGATSPIFALNSVTAANSGGYSVVVSSAYGSALSATAYLAVLTDGANGSQPAQTTAPSCPLPAPGVDSLVLVTHGWEASDWGDITWITDMSNAIRTRVDTTHWEVRTLDWREAAWSEPDIVLGEGAVVGAAYGWRLRHERQWQRVHLIAHSAGSEVIDAMATVLKLSPTPPTRIHETFLDPYLGTFLQERNAYGASADWADCYFTEDAPDRSGSVSSWISSLGGYATAGNLPNAYNVDVSWVDPGAHRVTSSAGPVAFSTHSYAHEFYMKTVTNTDPNWCGARYGFALSAEANGEGNQGRYRVGNVNSPNMLNAPQGAVAAPWLPIASVEVGWASVWGVATSAFGTVWGAGGAVLRSICTICPRPLDGGASTNAPAWLAVAVPVTNEVNFVQFGAAFTSPSGAQGLLTVYWNTNQIGMVDERAASPGLQTYQFLLPDIVTNGLYTLSFRLDSFTNITSSVTVTNVAVGMAGVAQPITLDIAFVRSNATRVLKLTGASNFTYLVEASTNLVDWVPTALLLNTNGTVSFTDPDAASYKQRFYRAMLLYQTFLPPPPQFSQATLLPGGAVQIGLLGGVGQTLTIQASTNLLNWADLTNVVLTNGTGQFTDISRASYNRRFYRALAP